MGRPFKNPPVEGVSADETPEIVETDTSLQPLSTNDLLKLVASMQQQVLVSQQEAAKANAALAAAILETTKPREVLKTKQQQAQEINDANFLKNQKELQRRQKENKRIEQSYCDHVAGGLGAEKDLRGRLSIVWHRNDLRVDVGICTVCQKIFRPGDEDYLRYRNKKSINLLSTAGDHWVEDPLKAQRESFLQDSD